jgi:cytochrome c
MHVDLQDRKFLFSFALVLGGLALLAVILLFVALGLQKASGDANFAHSRLARRLAYERVAPVAHVAVAGVAAKSPSISAVASNYVDGGAVPKNIEGLMKGQGCFACHAVDTKIVGPAYAWVAYHYRGDAQAVLHLAHKILAGGAGYWNPWTGGIAMPAHPQLSLAQAEAMARWVLARHPIAPPHP